MGGGLLKATEGSEYFGAEDLATEQVIINMVESRTNVYDWNWKRQMHIMSEHEMDAWVGELEESILLVEWRSCWLNRGAWQKMWSNVHLNR